MAKASATRRLGESPDIAAWMTLYGARLRRYFARRAAREDVDDLVQEVFLSLHQAHAPPPILDVERYLYTVARHALIDMRRNRAVRRWAQHDALDDVPEPSSDLSPERILVGRQDYARAIKAVRDLPPRARAAFQLHRFEELTYAAIAQRMGISRESVKELLHRAALRVHAAMRPDP
ncbi:MAG: sigma-70 family RNA polymerase sigma factor [Caulobacteraceae bacterium]|nr:sigma-70 family RNA polymerase sigma factor [Caulobacteraceae bacterium]